MTLIIQCPHCKSDIEIVQVNCGIFRHGMFKNTFQQIPPHSSKEDCDKFVELSQIYGCGKPFSLILRNGNYIAEECEYI